MILIFKFLKFKYRHTRGLARFHINKLKLRNNIPRKTSDWNLTTKLFLLYLPFLEIKVTWDFTPQWTTLYFVLTRNRLTGQAISPVHLILSQSFQTKIPSFLQNTSVMKKMYSFRRDRNMKRGFDSIFWMKIRLEITIRKIIFVFLLTFSPKLFTCDKLKKTVLKFYVLNLTYQFSSDSCFLLARASILL